MTAWSLLVENSSLNTGTSWDHLNNQEGGGSILNIYGENVATIDGDINAEIELSNDYYVTMDSDIDAIIEQDDYITSIDDDLSVIIEQTDNTATIE